MWRECVSVYGLSVDIQYSKHYRRLETFFIEILCFNCTNTVNRNCMFDRYLEGHGNFDICVNKAALGISVLSHSVNILPSHSATFCPQPQQTS